MNGLPGPPRTNSAPASAGRDAVAASPFPIAVEIPYELGAEHAFLCLVDLPFCIFLDSSLQGNSLGRFSFVAADPFETLVVAKRDGQPLRRLRQVTSTFFTPHVATLPPFQGGIAGVFSYELGQSFEQLPTAAYDEFDLPAVAVGVYDVVVAFDHLKSRAWIVSQGFPATDEGQRLRRATDRIARFQQRLRAPPRRNNRVSGRPLDLAAPTFAVDRHADLLSNFGAAEYRRAVADVVEYIRAGISFKPICPSDCWPVPLPIQ